MRMRAKSTSKSVAKQEDGQRYFSVDSLVSYQHRLSVGGEEVTPEEWQALVNAKSPLVHFRGQWMELDRERIAEMLRFCGQGLGDVEDLLVQAVVYGVFHA